MAKASAAPPPSLPPAPAPAAPPPAAAPAPANVVQRPAELPVPTGKLDFSEPLTKTYERQYRTDFSDPAEDAGGRDIPAPAELDAAMPPPDDKAKEPTTGTEPAKETPKPKAKRQSMGERTAVTADVQAHDDAQPGTAEPDTTATTEEPKPAVAVMSADDRRKALKSIEAEERRRVNEQTLATERERIKDIETKLKGPLVDRLLLAFPELAGTADQKRDQLMEMLVAGSIKLPEPGGTAAPTGAKTPEQQRIEALEEKLARLDPTTPVAQDTLAKARLATVATDLVAKGVALPFSTKPGATIMVEGKPMTADDLRLQVTKATYRLQGNRGMVDGVKVVQLVEQAFEDEFTKQWGADAASVIRGSKPAAAPAAKVEPKAAPPVQRRGGARGSHSGTVGGDPLPNRIQDRHKAMMREIDEMEGTVHFGPR